MKLVITLVAMSLSFVALGAADPTHGATGFFFVPAGLMWRPIGPAKQITVWNGPFDNAGEHPAQIYMVFSKVPEPPGNKERTVPRNLQEFRSLGTVFYYPIGAAPARDPAAAGYTATGFAIADKLFEAFPRVSPLLPNGLESSSCHSEQTDYYFIHENGSDAAYLVTWQPQDGVTNVVYLPAALLARDLDSVRDNLGYYAQGGMYEIMRFSALLYYLSRVDLDKEIASSPVVGKCPDTPTATEHGVEIPAGWIAAENSLKRH